MMHYGKIQIFVMLTMHKLVRTNLISVFFLSMHFSKNVNFYDEIYLSGTLQNMEFQYLTLKIFTLKTSRQLFMVDLQYILSYDSAFLN